MRPARRPFAQQSYPLEKLVEHLRPARDPGRTPFYQTVFILQSAGGEAPKRADTPMLWNDIHTATSKTDISVSLEDVGGALQGLGGIQHRQLSRRRLSNGWRGISRRCWKAAAANPDRSIAELDVLPAAERRKLVYEWNRTGRECPRSR